MSSSGNAAESSGRTEPVNGTQALVCSLEFGVCQRSVILLVQFLSRGLRLNPRMDLLAISTGGSVCGLVDAIIAVPILSAIWIISKNAKNVELLALILGQSPFSNKTIN